MSHNPRLADKNTTYTNARVTSIQTEEGTTNYSYACQSNVSQISRGSESFSFTYDGTLLTSINQTGQLNQTIDYMYNNAPQGHFLASSQHFNSTSMTYAGQTENYTYNDDGELISIGAMAIAPYTITRKQKNRKIIVSDGNYRQVTKLNKYGELRRQKDNIIKVRLKRNKVGQIVKKVEKLQGQRKKVYHYTYDDRGRLTKACRVGLPSHQGCESYTYDSNGNRQSATVNNQTITASYTLDDNLVVYGDNTYLYDDDGYLTEKTTPNGTTTYSYGTLGELLSVSTPTQNITYMHNANNQRVAKHIDGTVVEKYLWADLTTLLAVYDGNDTLKQRFEYANGRMPVAMTDANNTKYYLHYDQVGSLRAVSDTQMNIVKEITYDTFGNVLTDSNEAFKVPFGFAGGLYDVDTKLTRFGYRDYDAYTGKWTAKDPIGFQGGDSNLYGYVLGDPVGGFDSNGLWTLSTESFQHIWNSGPYDATVGGFDAYLAWDAIDIMYPHGETSESNAVRHCLWSCLMSKDIGKDTAKEIGDLHETLGDKDATDLWNNCVGRNIDKEESCVISCVNAWKNGDLK